MAATAAEALLLGIKAAGIDYLFANSGTDFPPIIEAYATLAPERTPVPVTVPHETAAVAMAHGYYLATGRMQACMVHVNVGLANAVMGVINAASDDVPVLMMSGRTPLTEIGHAGSRKTPVQYGQEMYDQSSLVADSVKFHYELRYPDQVAPLVSRAVEIALAEPRGPVYLSLPREPLEAEIPPALRTPPRKPAPPSPPAAGAEALERAAELLRRSTAPVILCQRADRATAAAVMAFAERFAIPVVEPFSVRSVMPSEHPMALGGDVGEALAQADLVLVLDSPTPWIEAVQRPRGEAVVVHVGPDPLFSRLPYRGIRADLNVTATVASALDALSQSLGSAPDTWEARRETLAAAAARKRSAARSAAAAGNTSPATAEWLSLCLSDAIDDDALVFHELGLVPAAMNLRMPNQLFTAPHSGGLGWGLPAALGAQLADRSRLVVAAVGDGSFMFANPVACLQVAEALELPVLILIKNNAVWNAVRRSVVNSYPHGEAVKLNRMPLVSLDPSPDFAMIAKAHRAFGCKVTDGQELPARLAEAIAFIREHRRPAVLDVSIAVSDKH